MTQFTVKDLMVPLSEYATVPEGSTLFEAVMALERAQEEFDHTKYRHRGILVLNKENQVVGKISQVDVLRVLEPKDESLEGVKELMDFSFSGKFVRNVYKQRRLQGASFKDLCTGALRHKVEDCMQTFLEGEYIDQDARLDTAIHHLILENLFSLLVTDNKKEIIGILRLSDVFAAVFHTMKECEATL
ncbi:MAG: CBS domain-containing protein [Desulfobacteraceae bacterium]|jgi:CBS domain-containing protein